MKKLLIILSFAFMLTGCGNNSETKDAGADSTTAKKEVADPEVAKGLELISKSDCFGCHKLTEASIGPAYAAIAAKYKTITPENMDSMVVQINKGGSGRWGTTPMTAHPGISKEDAQSMVHYIMSIKP
ncbi:MAG TPA: c-type cytochrome [Chitinophagaceae bacterium]|nr:c-type cytochrome [Chitinophagaceae bacterium]